MNRRRAGLHVVAAVTAASLLSSCQKVPELGAANYCDVAVEVDVDDDVLSTDRSWQTIGLGAREELGVKERNRTIYLWVRASADGEVTQFSITPADISDAPDGAGFEREIVLAGGRCPE